MRPTAATSDAVMQEGTSSYIEDSGWHLVDNEFADPLADSRSCNISPVHVAVTEETANAEASEQEQQTSGMASPTSELLADNVLRQPFGAAQTVFAAPTSSARLPHESDTATDITAHAASPAQPSFADELELAADSDNEAESVRSLSRMSQEGSLDGYSMDCGPEDLATEDEAQLAPDSANRGMVMGILEKIVSGVAGVVDDVALQVAEVRELLGSALSAAWLRLISVRDGVHGASASLRNALREASHGMARSGPLWTVLSLGSIATLSVALATQVFRNKKLAGQLRAHDRELARLVVKILHLQDALHNVSRSGAVPMLRHSTMLIA